MTTTVILDDALLQEAILVGGASSENLTIETDLRRMIEHKAQESIHSSYSRVDFWADYHYKVMRPNRLVDLQA